MRLAYDNRGLGYKHGMGHPVILARNLATLLLLAVGGGFLQRHGVQRWGWQLDPWVDLGVFAALSALTPAAFQLVRTGVDHLFFPEMIALREVEGALADRIFSADQKRELLRTLQEVLGFAAAGMYRRVPGRVEALWDGPSPAAPPLALEDLARGGMVPVGYHLGVPLEGRTGRMGLLVLGERARGWPMTALEKRILKEVCRLLAVSIENQWLGRAVIDRKVAERVAEDERQLNHRVNAVIAHQLKTPLLLAQSMLRDALDSLDNPSKVERRLDKVLASLARFERNVLQNLDRNGGLLKTRGLNLQPVDLAEVLERSLAEASYAIQKRGAVSSLALASPLMALADVPRLEIVLDNLLSNAIKVLPQEGSLTLAAGQQGDRIWLTLADNGPGVPPERLSGLFQEQGPHPGDPTSTGVGLAICREYLEAMGGGIALAGNGPQGATFRLELCASKANAALERAASRHEAKS